MSYGLGDRHSSDSVWLWRWLWCRPATTALIGSLAWEPPHALSAALKTNKQTKGPWSDDHMSGGACGAVVPGAEGH